MNIITKKSEEFLYQYLNNASPTGFETPGQKIWVEYIKPYDVDGALISLDVSGAFTDPDGDTLTYSATGLPAGLSINATTGVISGTLAIDASVTSPYTINVTADDGEGGAGEALEALLRHRLRRSRPGPGE